MVYRTIGLVQVAGVENDLNNKRCAPTIEARFYFVITRQNLATFINFGQRRSTFFNFPNHGVIAIFHYQIRIADISEELALPVLARTTYEDCSMIGLRSLTDLVW